MDPRRRFPALDLGAKVCFGVLFLLIRDVFWVLTSVVVWKDGIAILRAGRVATPLPGVRLVTWNILAVIN